VVIAAVRPLSIKAVSEFGSAPLDQLDAVIQSPKESIHVFVEADATVEDNAPAAATAMAAEVLNEKALVVDRRCTITPTAAAK
jgi:hypothetical protein